ARGARGRAPRGGTDRPATRPETGSGGPAAGTAAGVVGARRGGARGLARLGQLARLASEPPAGGDARLADPIDAAVWRATQPAWPEPPVRFGFDSARRMASGLVQLGDNLVLGVNGAPEPVPA